VNVTACIQAEGISFSYAPRTAAAVFEHVSFSVEPGKVFCLLGPNGTGKSTLLKCVGGLLQVRSGRVLVDGTNLRDSRPSETAQKIGYVPQNLSSAFPFRIKDIVVMGRAPHLGLLAAPSENDVQIAYDAMRTVGIRHLENRPCNSVSGGEWQLTLIARALAQQPKVLLLDEPTSHLDLGNQVKVLQSIKTLAGNGMTVIMASHFPDHAFVAADLVAILNEGRLSQTGAPEEVITEANLELAYGVRVRVIRLPEANQWKICFPALK
jgi:iron complex transport system ATP-binding protein